MQYNFEGRNKICKCMIYVQLVIDEGGSKTKTLSNRKVMKKYTM